MNTSRYECRRAAEEAAEPDTFVVVGEVLRTTDKAIQLWNHALDAKAWVPRSCIVDNEHNTFWLKRWFAIKIGWAE